MPAATPVTEPSVTPMFATDRLLLLHVPPVTALVSDVTAPAHTLSVPEMAGGKALTLTTVAVLQPVPIV